MMIAAVTGPQPPRDQQPRRVGLDQGGELSLDAVFSALADPTRRAIAERLAHGPASMTELAEPFDVTLPAIVKQLASGA